MNRTTELEWAPNPIPEFIDGIRGAASDAELIAKGRQLPAFLGELSTLGLSSAKVVRVYADVIDDVVRRALALELERQSDLAADRFTWLALGSTGRREALPASDLDAAVIFADDVSEHEAARFRAAFGRVGAVLARAGFSRDDHGISPDLPAFSRTHAQWRAAVTRWLAKPAKNKGVIMTSLIVDARPIIGSAPPLGADLVLGDLRHQPATLRLLLTDALARRARLRSPHEMPWRWPEVYDIKEHAMLPLVNLSRWSALAIGSTALSTTDRLEAAAGSALIPTEQARSLVEVVELLCWLRLRHQLQQAQSGKRPSDGIVVEQLTAIDLTIVAEGVREIWQAQKRLANVANYVSPDEWALPETPG